VPDLGSAAEQAMVIDWIKSIGDSVAADEPICRLAVNELQFEVHSTAAGELIRVFATPGDSVRSGDSLAEIAPPRDTHELDLDRGFADDVPEPEAEISHGPPEVDEPPVERIEPEPVVEQVAVEQDEEPFYATPPSAADEPESEPEREDDHEAESGYEPESATVIELPTGRGGPAPASQPEPAPAEPEETSDIEGSADNGVDWSHWHSPVVKMLAEKHGVDLSEVRGTGTGGRIRKRDVIAHIEGTARS